MACQFSVYLNAGQYESGAEVAIEALDLIERLEEQLSVYRDTSEITQINRRAAQEHVPLESRLAGLLATAVRVSAETGGAFDITAGPLVKTWGFHKRSGVVPGEAELRDALARVGSQHLVLDRQRDTIHFQQSGMELNLGAIGKGYALDRAAELLAAAGIHDFLIHGGQSSVLAQGRMPAAMVKAGSWASVTRSAPSVAWPKFASATRPWPPLARRTSFSGTRGSDTATSLTHAPVIRPRACLRRRSSPSRPRKPMPCRPPFIPWESQPPGSTASSIPRLEC